MVEETAFRGIITFLENIGIYDVVLPFILVFTIVFAILEKTRIFGTEKIGEDLYPKKNLNSMVAFVIAFLVIASSRLVATINEAMANVVLLLLIAIAFLMLIGTFYKETEDVYLEKGPWRTFFMSFMFLGMIFIFLHAIRTKEGDSWLVWFWEYLKDNWTENFVGALILIVFIIAFMYFITNNPSQPVTKEKEE